MLNKVILSLFFAHKKYPHSFVNYGYTTDDVTWSVLPMSLRWCLCQKLICVPKMNEGLTGLERHEGE